MDTLGAWIAHAWAWMAANADPVQAVCVLAGTVAAFLVIAHAGLISRREATIAMVNAQFGEEGAKYQDFKNTMQLIEANGNNIADYAKEDPDEKPIYDIILRQVNRYELIALGIRQGVFNEKFYKMWFFSQVMRDYEKLSPFINETRQVFDNQAYFCEFESLAKRWDRKRHPVKHPPKWKIAYWVMTGKFTKALQALNAR
ncbi:DUF4760 domain-containing protein [Sphingobium ummariense]|uniref:DUF4760 domain-containing protein n=1 Tax=Sphingobium ummariense RL-3 TaxID=1346791 RepID=T0J638_9SPHN|nr:DUF4760 domain-containing protein [Sphingobium ummariense]EQB33446.1 hypothetical protein M529_04050 [Sphingobium ummariense RL-3]